MAVVAMRLRSPRRVRLMSGSSIGVRSLRRKLQKQQPLWLAYVMGTVGFWAWAVSHAGRFPTTGMVDSTARPAR